MEFWNRVSKCEHTNTSPNYLTVFRCDTPYCEVEESHCLDCGVFISKCGCGFSNGMSGWPERRNRNNQHKKRKQAGR